MLVFCTVGSTKYDSFVQAVLSSAVRDAFKQRGYTQIVLQHGHSVVAHGNVDDVELWPFKPSLEQDFRRADLVVSHAGVHSYPLSLYKY